MSDWVRLDLDVKIREILSTARRVPDHHFERPFLTPYQIAIAFERRYPADFAAIGLQVGGRGIGARESLAQYIARELSRRIKNVRGYGIEGAFLSRSNLQRLEYRDRASTIVSSSQTSYHLSIFRLDD
ncbi:MAG: hypothetical protein HKL90_06470 [Elusimicrobia bacterium]|nr:hypothetical protein [Elusimicrobiota bacterium]